MLRTIAYSQLDPSTRAYLREVRQARGRGAPGVFDGTSDSRGVWAVLAGLVILPVGLWLGYSTNKAPWAMALLQTASVMLGGWLILYAVRRWTAGLDRYAGKFVYFDPEHVFVGQGEELKYARLGDDPAVEPAGDTAVKFRTEGGEFTVPVPSRTVAMYVADYYDALSHLREDENGWWRGSEPAVLGAMARYMVVNERVPANLSEVVLEIEDTPEEVRPARGRPSGVLRYLLILAVGAAVYAGFAFTNQPVHDAGAFAAVNQSSPADLRHYLADPNTRAHHDEANKKLNDLYDAKVRELNARANTDAEVRGGFTKLLDSLRGTELPAVSLSVRDESKNAVGQSWSDTLRTRLADGIGTEVGKEYILLVRRPGDLPPTAATAGEPFSPDAEQKPALIQLRYTTDNGPITWTLEFRLTPADDKPYLTVTRVVPADGSPLASEAVYADVMRKMLGNAPAAPPQLPLDDW
jgi:hypothetical protein